MRVAAIGILAVVVLGAGAAYLGLLESDPVHISAFVPDDFAFGVFHSSLDDLVAAYEGKFQHRDFNPARRRIGMRINAPDLNGISYHDPVGSFWTPEMEEILIVPYRDFGAYEDAHAVSRENVRLREPHKIGGGYLSVSESDRVAERGRDNPLVADVASYPLMLAGHPRDARRLYMMLVAMLGPDNNPHPTGIYPLSQELKRIPRPALEFAAAQCKDLVLGLKMPGSRAGPVDVELKATPQAALARAGGQADLGRLLGALPIGTVLFLGAVLDGKGWEEAGLLFPLGDGALVFAILEAGQVWQGGRTQFRPRPYTFLVAALPRDPTRLDQLSPQPLLDAPAPEPEVVGKGATKVKTSRIGDPPAWLATMLRSGARKAPPVYASTAVEGGIWLCAIGSWAEEAISHTLGCLRGAPELSIRSLKMAPLSAHRDLLKGGPIAAGMITPEGLKALRYPVLMVELASIGQPRSVTFALYRGEKTTGVIRFAR